MHTWNITLPLHRFTVGAKVAPNPAASHSPISDHAELRPGFVSLRYQRGCVLTKSPLGQNRRFAFLAISHQTSGRGLDAKLDQNAIEPKR